ncbi:hypothetical protein [Pseudarthrobacter polychromogenes]|uniref:Uncharacterized protein n=1 Tax=Pseudarthrobacter polychromogenes TaxID=1676 RepID=A0ABQ1XAY4_9MICC|nr:hypothetical protein [Pseudarthrobacter polychromogenes]GGG87840.1 hypothetical protein GCM10011577_07480 [Pseudarthrobacter polychromogenes]
MFLAGAATLTWLTFSASAASADTLQDATSLLGGVTGSVSSVAEELPLSVASLADPAPAASAPAPDSSTGLLQPLAGEVSGLADQIVSSVPFVNNVIPAGTVSVIAVPVAESVDVAVAEAVEAVIQPVTEILPVLEPALQPVEDLVSAGPGLPELPVAVPDDMAPSAAVPGPIQALAPTSVAVATPPAASAEPASTGIFEVPGTGTPAAGPVDVATTYVALQTAVLVPNVSEGQPGAADPSTAPAQAPPAPGSATGSSTTSAASSGAAAWLSPFDLNLPTTGVVLAGEFSEHAPAPVSFDPGSSPD